MNNSIKSTNPKQVTIPSSNSVSLTSSSLIINNTKSKIGNNLYNSNYISFYLIIL